MFVLRGAAIARQLIESALTDMDANENPVLIVNMTGYNEDIQCGKLHEYF